MKQMDLLGKGAYGMVCLFHLFFFFFHFISLWITFFSNWTVVKKFNFVLLYFLFSFYYLYNKTKQTIGIQRWLEWSVSGDENNDRFEQDTSTCRRSSHIQVFAASKCRPILWIVQGEFLWFFILFLFLFYSFKLNLTYFLLFNLTISIAIFWIPISITFDTEYHIHNFIIIYYLFSLQRMKTRVCTSFLSWWKEACQNCWKMLIFKRLRISSLWSR